MALIVKEAPEGFGASVELMNTMKQDILTEICYEVIEFLQYNIGAVKTEKWLKKIQETDTMVDIIKVQSAINSVIYLYRASAGSHLTEEQFTEQLGTSMVFSESTTSVLCSVWSAKGKSLISSGLSEQCLGVGQLIDVQWKVGVAVSSDSCKNLNSPFVCLALTVADTSGHLTTHNLELTMLQFRNFRNQLKEIGTVLETV